MSDRSTYVSGSAAQQAEFDEGLRSYMLRVYNYMMIALGVTGAVAWFVSVTPALMVPAMSLRFGLVLAMIGVGFFAHKIFFSQNPLWGYLLFGGYAVLWGVLIAPWFAILNASQVINAFFMTAALFGSMSLFGYTTKMNLAPMGQFLMMAAFGLMIVCLATFILPMFGIEMFKLGSAFHVILACAIILVFSGLTAYETQEIKSMYTQAHMMGQTHQYAVMGAFILYGSFVTLFQWILSLMSIFNE